MHTIMPIAFCQVLAYTGMVIEEFVDSAVGIK